MSRKRAVGYVRGVNRVPRFAFLSVYGVCDSEHGRWKMSAEAKATDGEASNRTPPYVSYKTFLTLIEDLKTHGIPPQLDRSALSRFAGGTVAQLFMALRSLGLLNDNVPTSRLHALVKASGTPEFKSAMKEALRVGYPFLSNLDLNTATPSMFTDAFKVTGVKEDVLKKCRRFYLQAAADIGIPIGPRILNRPRGGAVRSPGNANPTPPRRRAAPVKKSAKTVDPGASPSASGTIQQQLVAKFPNFDPTWPNELKAAWFAGFKDLMASADSKENGGQK
jgi:hypothetical protein